MVDPKTALTLAQAGVTLNDSVEAINAKLAKQSAIEQKTDLINTMAAKGYQYLATPGQLAGKPSYQLVTQLDANGNTLTFWDPTAKSATSGGTATGASSSLLGSSSLSKTQKEALSGYLGELGGYTSRDEALAELNRYEAKIKIDVGDAGYKILTAEINRIFPAPDIGVPLARPVTTPKTVTIAGDRREALPQDRRTGMEKSLSDFLFR
jgi:hypothetical protein